LNSVLVIPYKPPFDWASMLRFFAYRAVDSVEQVTDAVYRRTIRHGAESGILQVSHEPGVVRAEFWLPSGDIPPDADARLRRMFDLDADPDAIAAHLSRDPSMAAHVAARPTPRGPGGWEPFETAVRTVAGQQVSIEAARRLNARLVERCGQDLANSPFPALTRLFPTPEAVIAANLDNMGMPGARVATFKSVAEAVIADPHLFRSGASAEETVSRLRAIKGIGEWTAQYIAMRACREPDAFPAGDAGILRGMSDASGTRPKQADLLRRAEAWRPWRAYAAHYIWAEDEALRVGTHPGSFLATPPEAGGERV
jgi:AraC family transcriptional regulator, regulatory protein of adaptative response / DNA-3-methyladenine glycosylase II